MTPADWNHANEALYHLRAGQVSLSILHTGLHERGDLSEFTGNASNDQGSI